MNFITQDMKIPPHRTWMSHDGEEDDDDDDDDNDCGGGVEK